MSSRAPFKPDSKFVSHVRPAVNVEARRDGLKPTLLIMHYTGMSSAAKAIDWLACAESKVSCHYVIDETGLVTQMVPEAKRAWHAGVSQWRGQSDINSRSIGIEIQNPGHQHGYPDFSAQQMRAVLNLGKDIVARHRIAASRVLAHSDVAPDRKIDPGEKFDWAFLAKHGLGFRVRPSPVMPELAGRPTGPDPDRVAEAQRLLSLYGYDCPQNGTIDEQTKKVIRAFQLHFRPRRVDGRLDRSTELTLRRLVSAAGGKAIT